MSSTNQFSGLKEYAAFLLKHHLSDAAHENYTIAKEVKFSLLNLMAHMQPVEIQTYFERIIEEFILQLLDDSILKVTEETFDKLRSDQLAGFSKKDVKGSDIISAYSARKLMLIRLLPLYTQDMKLVISLIQEIELLHKEIQEKALDVYVEIQKEFSDSIQQKLQDQQTALEDANEKLQATNEELQVSNEELHHAQHEHKKLNRSLQSKSTMLESAIEALRNLNNELESRVSERTEKLSESEKQMRLVTDALPVLITYVDKDEKYRFNNKTYETWFGKPRSEVYGKYLWEVMGKEAYEYVKFNVKRALAGEKINLETELVYKGAGRKFTSINYIPHVVEGEVEGYYCLISDISEQKNIQSALEHANSEITSLLARERVALAEAEAQRKRLYNIFMKAPSILCIMQGPRFTFELANPFFLDAVQIEGPIEGKNLHDVLPNLGKEVVAALKKVITNRRTFIGTEFPITSDWNKNGIPYTRYINLICEPLVEANDQVEGIIVFGYEVSDHVKAKEELKKLNNQLLLKNEELEKTNKDLDNFIYTASHDLKSPIVNLEGLISLMQKNLDRTAGSNEKKVMAMIDKSVLKLKQTISDLAEIIKVQKNLEDDPEVVSFLEVLDNVMQDIPKNLEDEESLIHVDFKVPYVNYTKNNLRSILHNLLTNAIKYKSPERRPEVHIKTYLEDGKIVLSVEDNGLGISKKHLPKMFTMFKRLHTHVEGTGIGLYLIKRIVENNKGKILLESDVEKGSTFKIYF